MGRGAVAIVATCVALVVAAPAQAGFTTYWPSVYQSACGYSDMAGVGPSDVKRRGNFGYNRRWSYVYSNGGQWTWGAYYTSGTRQNSVHNQAGAWSSYRENSYYSSQQLDPFIQNLNGSTVSGAGCFQWV